MALLLTFSFQLIKVRVIRENAHLTPRSEYIHQVVHVIRGEGLVFLGDFLGGNAHES